MKNFAIADGKSEMAGQHAYIYIYINIIALCCTKKSVNSCVFLFRTFACRVLCSPFELYLKDLATALQAFATFRRGTKLAG